MNWNYKYFTKKEMECRCGCGMLPTPEFMSRLEALREYYGKAMRVTSAARCEMHNAKVGGAIESKHVDGIAVDIAVSPTERWTLVHDAMKLQFHGIGIAKTFIHLDIRPFEERRVWQYGN